MMVRPDDIKRKAALALVTAAVLASANGTYAGESAKPFSLTIYPARIVLASAPASQRVVLHISNTGSAALHVQVALSEFTQAASGQIQFRTPGPLSAASWVAVNPPAFD